MKFSLAVLIFLVTWISVLLAMITTYDPNSEVPHLIIVNLLVFIVTCVAFVGVFVDKSPRRFFWLGYVGVFLCCLAFSLFPDARGYDSWSQFLAGYWAMFYKWTRYQEVVGIIENGSIPIVCTFGGVLSHWWATHKPNRPSSE